MRGKAHKTYALYVTCMLLLVHLTGVVLPIAHVTTQSHNHTSEHECSTKQKNDACHLTVFHGFLSDQQFCAHDLHLSEQATSCEACDEMISQNHLFLSANHQEISAQHFLLISERYTSEAYLTKTTNSFQRGPPKLA